MQVSPTSMVPTSVTIFGKHGIIFTEMQKVLQSFLSTISSTATSDSHANEEQASLFY